MGNFKYPLYTDKIYVSIFREKAQEYRKVLRLDKKDKVRDTFYAEILDLVASYEYGFAKVLEKIASSPLNVPSIKANITTQEIVDIVRKGRER
jgi:hypothetical protein